MKSKNGALRTFLVVAFVFISSGWAMSAQWVTGDITSAIILQERIHLTVGDKAVTNLGAKDGVIKGDILIVTTSQDVRKEKPIGQCAVTSVDAKSSICEMIAASMEIARGSKVSLPAVYYSMEKFYPAILGMLSKAVEPFPPHERVNIAVYDIFDADNNVTQFSDRLRQEMRDIFSEKKRVRVIDPRTVKKDFIVYPEDIKASYGLRSEVMETLGVDVFFIGSYTVSGETGFFTFYKFDKNFKDEKISFQVPLGAGELASAGSVARAYKPVPKKEFIPCSVAYTENHYTPQKDEKRDIVNHEAGRDVYKAYELRRTNFNIVSPIEFVFKLDGQPVNFSGKRETPVLLTKGTHTLYASFRRGYFFNTREPKLYVSDRPVEKEAILSIDRDAAIYIDVVLNPSFEGDNIEFKIYDVTEKKSQLIRPIIRTEASKSIEFFKH